MIEATLKDGSTVNLTNENLLDEVGDYAAVVAATASGVKEILGKTPFDAAEEFFYRYLDACKAREDEPIITYHSYD